MGYSVYWANGRWQGYGVPAYCDYPGCKEEIDRGMGYAHAENDNIPNSVFCCNTHKYHGLPEDFELEEKEHPDWLRHILNDDSWKQWRENEPELVKKYRELLNAIT